MRKMRVSMKANMMAKSLIMMAMAKSKTPIDSDQEFEFIYILQVAQLTQ